MGEKKDETRFKMKNNMTKAVKMLYAHNVIGKSAALFIWSMLCLSKHSVAVTSKFEHLELLTHVNLWIPHGELDGLRSNHVRCFTNTPKRIVHFPQGSTRLETCTSRSDNLAAVHHQKLSDRTGQIREKNHLYLNRIGWSIFREE